MIEPDLKSRILALDAATPRYTSYPPATAFKADFPEETHRSWLAELSAHQTASLYVHIPFCEKLCYYCGCFTSISARDERIEAYVDDLICEIGLVHNTLSQPVVLSHLHFGGGSPTFLKPALFTRIIKEIRRHFSFTPTAEIAVEADPRQMSEGRIATFALSGVTRISLGMQDTNQEILSAVNRPQPFYLSWDAARLCREYGINQINLDLMYGLPGQTVKTITATIETALTLQPDRVAFFGYAHVPWMKKHMQMIDKLQMPDTSSRYDLYETGRALLINAGYLPVGIDHFVRPTDSMAQALKNRTLQRNFQGYTTDTAPALIGLGASSISKFPQGYAQNTADFRLYHDKIAQGHLPLNKGFSLQVTDKARSAVISEIMCYMASDLVKVAAHHHLPENYFSSDIERLKPLQNSGLVSVEGSLIHILHPHVARLAASCFDPMTSESTLQNRHSRAI